MPKAGPLPGGRRGRCRRLSTPPRGAEPAGQRTPPPLPPGSPLDNSPGPPTMARRRKSEPRREESSFLRRCKPTSTADFQESLPSLPDLTPRESFKQRSGRRPLYPSTPPPPAWRSLKGRWVGRSTRPDPPCRGSTTSCEAALGEAPTSPHSIRSGPPPSPEDGSAGGGFPGAFSRSGAHIPFKL